MVFTKLSVIKLGTADVPAWRSSLKQAPNIVVLIMVFSVGMYVGIIFDFESACIQRHSETYLEKKPRIFLFLLHTPWMLTRMNMHNIAEFIQSYARQHLALSRDTFSIYIFDIVTCNSNYCSHLIALKMITIPALRSAAQPIKSRRV